MNIRNHKPIFLYVVFLLILSLTGCSKKSNNNIEFNFNSNNEYLGFKDLAFSSIKDAKESYFVVFENGYLTNGQESWNNFLAQSSTNIDTQIRIYNVIAEKDYHEYIDIFYRDSLYYVFSSNDKINKSTGYKYLYDLNDASLNDLKTFFIVISNSSDITYTKVMNDQLSSIYINNKDYKIVVWGIR